MNTAVTDADELARRGTLLTAYEEGGLYELVWWVNGRYRDLDVSAKYRLADRALRECLEAGFVELVRAPPSRSDPDRPLSMVDALALLNEPTAWYPSNYGGEDLLELRLTPAGVEVLRNTDTRPLFELPVGSA